MFIYNAMKILLTFFGLNIIFSTFSHAGSFSNALLNHTLKTDDYLSLNCTNSLIRFYERGKSLNLKSIQKNKIPLFFWNLDPENAKISGTKFYHYTSYEPTIRSFENGDFYFIFEELKKRNEAMRMGHEATGVLWVAGDPFSSEIYGNWKIEINLKSQTNLFNYEMLFNLEMKKNIEAEIATLSAAIAKECNYLDIAYFWLEDSGVDLINQPTRKMDWFTLLNSEKIDKVSVNCKYSDMKLCTFMR